MTESEYYKLKWKSYKEQQLAQGNCIKCGTHLDNPNEPCPHCIAIRKERRDFRIEHGLCVTCGKENDYPLYQRCSVCRQKRKNAHLALIKAGFCSRCRKPHTGKHKCCPECREKAREYMRRRKECQGL